MLTPALDGIEKGLIEVRSEGHRDSVVSLLPGLADLWQETLGDPDIRIAILDGPVDLSHPCFRGAEIEQLPTLVPATGPSDHGTHVTSLICGQHESQIAGVAPRCKSLVLPVFQQAEDGALRPCSQQDLARNISLALEAGAHIINISGGELTSSGRGIDFLENAVRQAAERNVLIIAATGNDGCECLHVPAALPNVLPIGALDIDGRHLGSSNWSGSLEGIMAPGAMIKGALPGGRTGAMNGTSFATPLVSGVAALLLSLQKQQGQAPDAAAIRRALIAGAAPCEPADATECQRWLRGALNISAARNRVAVSGRASESETFSNEPSPQTSKGDIMRENTESGAPTQEANVQPSEEGIQPSLCGSTLDQLAPAMAEGVEASTEGIESTVSPAAEEPVALANVGPASGGAGGSGPATGASVGLTPSGGAREASLTPASFGGVLPSCQAMSMFSPFPPGQKAFTIGKLYYDFGTEARRDYFIAQIRSQYQEHGIEDKFNQGLVYSPDVMIKYLFGLDPTMVLSKDPVPDSKTNHLDAANALIWTVFIDQDPVYALVPEDQYAVVSFTRLAAFLADQGASLDPKTFRVAMAGSINGSITLFNGTVVPQLSVVTRGMFDWDIEALVEATSPACPEPSNGGDAGSAVDPAHPPTDPVKEGLRDFLLRIYDSLRNLGVTSEDRAKNFAATNAYQARQAFVWANSDGREFKLDSIGAARSPICRRNSDCWDISLTFFDPKNLFQTARQVFEYTIDVSDVVPVQVGEARQYPVYGGPNQ